MTRVTDPFPCLHGPLPLFFGWFLQLQLPDNAENHAQRVCFTRVTGLLYSCGVGQLLANSTLPPPLLYQLRKIQFTMLIHVEVQPSAPLPASRAIALPRPLPAENAHRNTRNCSCPPQPTRVYLCLMSLSHCFGPANPPRFKMPTPHHTMMHTYPPPPCGAPSQTFPS